MAEQAAMSDTIAKAVVEVTRATIQTMVDLNHGQEDQRPKVGGLVLRQLQFKWEMADKYTEWKVFVLEVRNVISTYNACKQEKIAMVKNWLGRRGLHYIKSLTEVEKQACGTLQGLIDTLAKKFRPQYNETIKSLQFRQLCRHEGENAEEWMGRLQVAAAECNYKEIDWQLKEQFIHGLNNKTMLDEVIRELTTKSSSDQMTSEDMLIWAKRVEAQRMQALILSDITDSQRFDQVKVVKQQTVQRMTHRASSHQPCMCYGSVHAPRGVWHMGRCALVAEKWAISRRCAGAGKTTWFMKWKWMCLRKKAK